MNSELPLIVPEWPAPAQIRAFSTTRWGGLSSTPWNSLNLAGHVGDDPERVEKNQSILSSAVGLSRSSLFFLNQVHGTRIVEFPCGHPVDADACHTSEAKVACPVLSADCLPVLFCNRAGTRVAAAHAGWRGLCQGVLEQAVAELGEATDLMAWMGPAIGPQHFEVGAEVRDAFMHKHPEAHQAFAPGLKPDHFLADLYQLARQRLTSAGVSQIYGGHWCTFSQPERFFSYRRDGVTGRMASLIFID